MTSGRVGQQGRRIDYLAALTVARQFLAELSAVSELRGTDFQFDKVSELKTLAEIIHCISCIFFLSSLHDMHKVSVNFFHYSCKLFFNVNSKH